MSSTRPAATARSGRGLPEARAPQEAVGDDGTGAALRRRRLTPVLRDSPACVLLLDLADQAVVQANTAGGDLVPGLRLPTSVPEWVAAAGLRRTDGSAHAPGDDPVSRIAAGEAVDGEPVLVAPHASPLWMTGFAIPHHDDAPSQALVVLFALDGGADAEVRDRAVLAAGLSFTISDPRLPDNPLVFVNPAFERTTGYRREEVQGRNCRFLQGPDTDPDAVEAVRKALRGREHRTVTLLNYRKDGSAFCNELAVPPVVDATGELTHFVGIQSDVTARVAVEHERERHLAAERAARSAAERAQRRLALLAEATSMLAATLDVDESLERLTSLVVPLMADWCTVHLRTPDGRVQRASSRHRDESQAHLLRRLEELQPTGLTDDSNIAHVLAGAPATLVHIDEEVLTAGIADEELALIYRELSPRSALVVPLAARRQVLGVLSLFTDGSGRTYDDDDLVTAADLARRAALTVDNARLYQREHDVAEQLQRSLLPQLPTVAGLDRWHATCPARRPRRSAATGTTCSACPTGRSGSRSATSWATTWPPPPPWASSGRCCRATPGRAATRPSSWAGSTSSCRASTWRSSRPARTAGSSCRPGAGPDGCASPTPVTSHRPCARPTARSSSSRRSPRCWSVPRSARTGRLSR